VRDVIDVQFYSAEECLTLLMRRDGREFTVKAERRYDEPLGLEFAHPTFDGIRRCNNRCEFCFVAQMPPGLRPSLCIRDDDYRYSFLFGNYITLTNLNEDDWERIGEQHLSPLYVSVHATDLALRRRILRNPAAPDIIAQLRRLADLGIEVHTQIVVLPGLNDGPHLERAIGDLARLTGAAVASLSDEWYLRLGEEVPPAEAYDGLDLTENGVGLVRRFLSSGSQVSEFQVRHQNLKPEISKPGTITLVTGTLFASVLRRVTAKFANVEIVPVVNHFFGETVTVAGLLTGRDVVEQLRRRKPGGLVVLPRAMFGGPEGQSLDEMWPQEVGEALGREVVVGDDKWQHPGSAMAC